MADNGDEGSTWTPGGTTATKEDPFPTSADTGSGWSSAPNNSGSTWTPSATTDNNLSKDTGNGSNVPKEEPEFGSQRGADLGASTMGCDQGSQ